MDRAAPPPAQVTAMEAYVVRVLSELLLHPGLTPSSRLMEDGILDSVGFVDFIVRAEADLGLRIGMEETDLEIFSSPGTIAAHLIRLGAAHRVDSGGSPVIQAED